MHYSGNGNDMNRFINGISVSVAFASTQNVCFFVFVRHFRCFEFYVLHFDLARIRETIWPFAIYR